MATLHFGAFLFMYLVTLLGNLLIIVAMTADSHLHTPMYFFLSNLFFDDICFTSTSIPKMLVNIQTQSKVIIWYIWRLYHPGIIFHIVWSLGQLSSSCDGPWQIRGHLSLPALHCHHEPLPLWIAGVGVLCHNCLEFLITKLSGIMAVLLYRLGNPRLCLWA